MSSSDEEEPRHSSRVICCDFKAYLMRYPTLTRAHGKENFLKYAEHYTPCERCLSTINESQRCCGNPFKSHQEGKIVRHQIVAVEGNLADFVKYPAFKHCSYVCALCIFKAKRKYKEDRRIINESKSKVKASLKEKGLKKEDVRKGLSQITNPVQVPIVKIEVAKHWNDDDWDRSTNTESSQISVRKDAMVFLPQDTEIEIAKHWNDNDWNRYTYVKSSQPSIRKDTVVVLPQGNEMQKPVDALHFFRDPALKSNKLPINSYQHTFKENSVVSNPANKEVKANNIISCNSNLGLQKVKKRHSLPTAIVPQPSYAKKIRSNSCNSWDDATSNNISSLKIKLTRDQSNQKNWIASDSQKLSSLNTLKSDDSTKAVHESDGFTDKNNLNYNCFLSNEQCNKENTSCQLTVDVKTKSCSDKNVPELENNDYISEPVMNNNFIDKQSLINNLSPFLKNKIKRPHYVNKTVDLEYDFHCISKRQKLYENSFYNTKGDWNININISSGINNHSEQIRRSLELSESLNDCSKKYVPKNYNCNVSNFNISLTCGDNCANHDVDHNSNISKDAPKKQSISSPERYKPSICTEKKRISQEIDERKKKKVGLKFAEFFGDSDSDALELMRGPLASSEITLNNENRSTAIDGHDKNERDATKLDQKNIQATSLKEAVKNSEVESVALSDKTQSDVLSKNNSLNNETLFEGNLETLITQENLLEDLSKQDSILCNSNGTNNTLETLIIEENLSEVPSKQDSILCNLNGKHNSINDITIINMEEGDLEYLSEDRNSVCSYYSCTNSDGAESQNLNDSDCLVIEEPLEETENSNSELTENQHLQAPNDHCLDNTSEHFNESIAEKPNEIVENNSNNNKETSCTDSNSMITSSEHPLENEESSNFNSSKTSESDNHINVESNNVVKSKILNNGTLESSSTLDFATDRNFENDLKNPIILKKYNLYKEESISEETESKNYKLIANLEVIDDSVWDFLNLSLLKLSEKTLKESDIQSTNNHLQNSKEDFERFNICYVDLDSDTTNDLIKSVDNSNSADNLKGDNSTVNPRDNSNSTCNSSIVNSKDNNSPTLNPRDSNSSTVHPIDNNSTVNSKNNNPTIDLKDNNNSTVNSTDNSSIVNSKDNDNQTVNPKDKNNLTVPSIDDSSIVDLKDKNNPTESSSNTNSSGTVKVRNINDLLENPRALSPNERIPHETQMLDISNSIYSSLDQIVNNMISTQPNNLLLQSMGPEVCIKLASNIYSNEFPQLPNIYTMDPPPSDTLKLMFPKYTTSEDSLNQYKKLLLDILTFNLKLVDEIYQPTFVKHSNDLLYYNTLSKNTWQFQKVILTIMKCITRLIVCAHDKYKCRIVKIIENTNNMSMVYQKHLRSVIELFQRLTKQGLCQKHIFLDDPFYVNIQNSSEDAQMTDIQRVLWIHQRDWYRSKILNLSNDL